MVVKDEVQMAVQRVRAVVVEEEAEQVKEKKRSRSQTSKTGKDPSGTLVSLEEEEVAAAPAAAVVEEEKVKGDQDESSGEPLKDEAAAFIKTEHNTDLPVAAEETAPGK